MAETAEEIDVMLDGSDFLVCRHTCIVHRYVSRFATFCHTCEPQVALCNIVLGAGHEESSGACVCVLSADVS